MPLRRNDAIAGSAEISEVKPPKSVAPGPASLDSGMVIFGFSLSPPVLGEVEGAGTFSTTCPSCNSTVLLLFDTGLTMIENLRLVDFVAWHRHEQLFLLNALPGQFDVILFPARPKLPSEQRNSKSFRNSSAALAGSTKTPV